MPRRTSAYVPVKCQLTVYDRIETEPYLGMDRRYKLYTALGDEGRTEVFPDHIYWMTYLPWPKDQLLPNL